MNEWVRRLRSSVQSVVDGKRRKSAASPQTDGSRRKTTHDEPAPPAAATELELPPAETPQLSSLTKQRARGPPRRRPSPGQRTVSCPPTDDDPARFAWGRDPTIDPALFFSDVVGRCLSAHPAAGMGSEGSARLGSIAESDSQRSSWLSEGDKRSSRVSENGKRSSRVSEGDKRSSSGSGSGTGSGEGEGKEEGQGEGERTDGDGESADSEADVKEEKEAGGGKADSEKTEAGVEKADARKEAERPVSAGRKSPVLHLTGGQVEGAPKKRFCTLL